MPRYGQKGGDGPTAGRKKSIYQAPTPDGKCLTSGSFFVNANTAYMHIYKHGDEPWRAGSIRAIPEDWGSPRGTTSHWVECQRIK
jgi:hypothetical protein